MNKPSAIRQELERLASLHGGELRPEVVVDAARPEDSPLHGSFQWDDSHAAQQWRLQQARMLIRALVMVESSSAGKKIRCRVFVSLTPDREKGGAGYRLTSTVMSNVERRAQMLADAKAEMLRFKSKYRTLTELAEVFDAMDRVGETTFAEAV